MGLKTLGARSPWRLTFVRWRLISLGPPFETCLRHSSGAINFEVASRLLEYCAPLLQILPEILPSFREVLNVRRRHEICEKAGRW